MKKIVLLFATTVLCGLAIKAQLKKNNDFADRSDMISRLIINHDTRNSYSQKLKAAAVYQKLDSAVRANTSKDYYVYDNNKHTIQQVSSVWQNQHWVNSAKEDDFTYDLNGNLSSMIGYTWNASLSQWIKETKSELTYSNNLISSALISEWKNNQWRNSFKSEYSFNSNNNTSIISYTWDTLGLKWDYILKFEYEYDNLNRRISSTNWIWSNNNWSNTSKTTYSYDANGNIILQNNYAWDISTNAWLLSSKDEFTYDINNRRISAIHSLSFGGVIWMNSTKIDYTYSYTVSPNNLILPYSGGSYYDQNINITAASYTSYNWNMIANNWDISYTMNKYFSDFDINAPVLTVSTNALNIGSDAYSTNTFDITSNLNWTAASNQSWLTLSNETGTGNKTITLTAAANPGSTSRTATVTVSATGVPSNTIIVTQAVPGIIVTVFLEGAYVGPLMNTALKTGGLVPLSQPYNVAPWNYAGTETVASIPADVVDWVLVELRQAATPAEALPGTVLSGWPKACFLKSNGSIVALDGASSPALGNPVITSNLYVIIRHRNHIAIMSAAGMTLTGSNYVYNFTDAISKAHGGSAGYKQIVPGIFGMVSGDTDGDGDISVLDFSKWATDFGRTTIYLPSDIDADGEVSVLDFSKWATNFGVGNIPPLKKLSLDGSGLKYRSQVPGLK